MCEVMCEVICDEALLNGYTNKYPTSVSYKNILCKYCNFYHEIQCCSYCGNEKPTVMLRQLRDSDIGATHIVYCKECKICHK